MNIIRGNEIPVNFLNWQKKLKAELSRKGIKQVHVYKSIGMSRCTWFTRLKKFNFTAQEALAICDVLNDKVGKNATN